MNNLIINSNENNSKALHHLCLIKRVASKLLSQYHGETITEDIVRTRYSIYGHGDEDDIVSIKSIMY